MLNDVTNTKWVNINIHFVNITTTEQSMLGLEKVQLLIIYYYCLISPSLNKNNNDCSRRKENPKKQINNCNNNYVKVNWFPVQEITN